MIYDNNIKDKSSIKRVRDHKTIAKFHLQEFPFQNLSFAKKCKTSI